MEAGEERAWQRPDWQERRGPGWQLIRHTSKDGASRLHLVQYDLEDAKLIEQFSWHVHPNHQTFYVEAKVPVRYQKRFGTRVTMHQLVMRRSRAKGRIGHLNGNGLDNRRQNLAKQSQAEILAKRLPTGSSSQYKGVSWERGKHKWLAAFRGKKLGRFDDEEEAARAFDDAAYAYWGPKAYLNFPDRYPEAAG